MRTNTPFACLCCAVVITCAACQRTPQSCLDAAAEPDQQRKVELYTRCLESRAMDDAERGGVYANRAAALYRLGRYAEALRDGEEAMRLAPEDPASLSNRGLALLHAHQPERALKDFQQALAKGETAARRNNLGLGLLALDRPGEAFTEFERALRLNPSLIEAVFNRGLARMCLGVPGPAVEDFSRAIACNVMTPKAHEMRGDAYMRMGQYQNAVEDFAKAMALNPRNFNACNNLAWLRATCPNASFRNGKEAVALSLKAIGLLLNARHLFTLAAAYARDGRFAEAAETQDKALAMLRIERTPTQAQITEITVRRDLYRAGQAYAAPY